METSHKHRHTAEINLHFKMLFRTDTKVIKAGEPVKLYFKPELESKPDYIVPLSFLHEKKIHLIIMSNDLSYFSHEHPELSKNGEYVWEHNFPLGGHYILFQDYMPEEAAQHRKSRWSVIKWKKIRQIPLPLPGKRMNME